MNKGANQWNTGESTSPAGGWPRSFWPSRMLCRPFAKGRIRSRPQNRTSTTDLPDLVCAEPTTPSGKRCGRCNASTHPYFRIWPKRLPSIRCPMSSEGSEQMLDLLKELSVSRPWMRSILPARRAVRLEGATLNAVIEGEWRSPINSVGTAEVLLPASDRGLSTPAQTPTLSHVAACRWS
jgi:hypothetical protein